MNIKELIFSLTGVEVNTENLADLKAHPRDYTESDEDASLLAELFFLLEKTEESEELS
ncbi:MAG: hypothetical protein AAGU15_06680 [Anaerolineaceae bacterium]